MVVLCIYVEAARLKQIGVTTRVTASQQAVECYTHIDTQTYRLLQQKLRGHAMAMAQSSSESRWVSRKKGVMADTLSPSNSHISSNGIEIFFWVLLLTARSTK